MDNERPIEKLLRRFAKKRRDELGTPPEMHPATRRMLQGEIARQFGKGKKAATKTSFAWWLQLACGVGVIVAAVAIVLPVLNKSKSPSLEMARGDSHKETDLAFQTRTVEKADQPVLPAQIVKSEKSPSKEAEQLGLKKNLDRFGLEVTNEATLAFADTAHLESSAPGGMSKIVAPPAVDSASGEIVAAPAMPPPSVAYYEGNTNLLTLSEGRLATTGLILSPASSSAAGQTPRFKTAEQGRANSVSQSQKSAALFSNTQKSESKTPVLMSFQVEQDGDELRMVDSDGSTYAGNILPVADAPADGKDISKGKYGERSRALAGAAGDAVNSSYNWNGSAQNNYFRVSGTNKTLKQQVVFTGNFIQVSNAVPLQAQNLGIANQLQNFSNLQAFPSFLNNSVIVGRAQLEKNNSIEVNAVPVMQK